MKQFSNNDYKKIRRYNKQEMEKFLINVYNEGVEAMAEKFKENIAKQIDFNDVLDALRAGKCRGIGKTTADKLEAFIREMEAEA